MFQGFHNFTDQVIRLDAEGVITGIYGDFDGIDKQGVVRGLLSPSDLVKIGDDIYVSNFALDVSRFGSPEHAASLYTKQVKRFSIARIKMDDEQGGRYRK